MFLHSERIGSGAPLVLVHGFTQTGRCWGPVAEGLSADHEVVLVDAPGHGRSADIMAGLRTGGRLIADQGGEATYIGYSLGARLCLHIALSNPELVRGLVLLGGTAGIEDPGERAARRDNDVLTGKRIKENGVAAFVDAWLDQPLFVGLPPEQRYRAERLENTVDGLISSVEQAGTGSQDPSWHKLCRLSMPVLAMAGADDAKFASLAARMAAEIGSNATLALVEGAGHAAHLEQPDHFLSALRPWLIEHGL